MPPVKSDNIQKDTDAISSSTDMSDSVPSDEETSDSQSSQLSQNKGGPKKEISEIVKSIHDYKCPHSVCHTCKKCNRIFLTQKAFEKHVLSEHGQNQ